MIKHDQSAYDLLNEKLKEQYAEIILNSGDLTHGFDVIIEIDSTSWIETKIDGKEWVNTDVEISVPTMDISKVNFGSAARGAKEGLKNGLLGGALGGIFLLGAYHIEVDSTSFEFKELLLIPILAGVGAIIGITFGIINMGTEEYILTKIPPDSTTSTSDRNKNEMIAETGNPVLQEDGFYRIEVSSLRVEELFIFVTWRDKDIRLHKNEVKQRRKSGDKYFIIISPKVYESTFLKSSITW